VSHPGGLTSGFSLLILTHRMLLNYFAEMPNGRAKNLAGKSLESV